MKRSNADLIIPVYKKTIFRRDSSVDFSIDEFGINEIINRFSLSFA